MKKYNRIFFNWLILLTIINLMIVISKCYSQETDWPEYGSNPFVFSIAEPVFDEQFFVADLNGDGLMDFTFRSETKIYAYDHNGTFLWSKAVDNPGGDNTGTKHGAADIDGDGQVEVVALNNKNQILIVNGSTGETERTISLPIVGDDNRWIHIAVVNLRGNGDHDVIVQTLDTTGVKQPFYVNRNLLAWDLENNREIWRVEQDTDSSNGIYEGYWGVAHGAFQCADVDGDGRDEVVGGNMIDDDGTIIDLGYPRDWVGIKDDGFTDHLDAISIGDYRPDISGLEWLLCEEDHAGNSDWHTTMMSTSGVVWREETTLPFEERWKEPQNVIGGEFDVNKSYSEVFNRSRFSGPDDSQHPWLFDTFGSQFADYATENVLPEGFNTHEYGNKEGLEMLSTIDWFGGTKEYVLAKARHVQGNIGVFDAVTGEAVWYTPNDFPETKATLVYCADIAGDSREEVIIYDENGTIRIYWNENQNNNSPKPKKWDDPLYTRIKQNWNYYSPGGYTPGSQSSGTNITIDKPNGGEILTGGTNYTISWVASESIDSLKLEYTLDKGDTWILIIKSTVNDGEYSWAVPDTTSDNCLVRISDINDSVQFDESDDFFSINEVTGNMEIVINCDDEYKLWINGNFIGENDEWNVAQTYSVPLVAGKNIVAVYGRNYGSGEGALIAQVKVDSDIVLITDGNWKRSTTEEPGWTDVAYDDGNWLAAVSHGQYGVEPWKKNISGFPENSQAEWIWSEDTKDTQKIWYFRGSFDSGEPSPAPEITSFTPDSGEVGTEVTISGNNFIDVTAVKFNDVSAGSYTVDSETQIRAVVATGSTTGRISVTASGGTGVSSDDFVVIEEPGITVTQPNGGERWLAGSTQQIKWNWAGRIDSVKMEYSLDSGGGWIEISGSAVNNGVYNWIVPDTLSETALVRVTDVLDHSVSDVSDALFSITAASITVTQPNGGESWVAGSEQEIQWAWEGEIDSVRLEYSLDNGGSWIEIVAGTANDGHYVWSIPQASSTQCLVCVSDASDNNPSDMSDGVFTIIEQTGDMKIVINCDDEYKLWVNGNFIGENDEWNVAQTYSVPTVAGKNVVAVYGRNYGSGDGALIAQVKVDSETVLITDSNWKRSATEEPGWTDVAYDDGNWFAAVSHGQYGVDPWKKNISGFPENSQAEWIWSEDTKDTQKIWYFRGNFNYGEHLSEITVTSPNGGEQWLKGNTYDIQWTSTGDIDSVKIEYSLNNGVAYHVITDATENDGNYSWLLPDTTADSCLIRISHTQNLSVSDKSDAIFAIVSSEDLEIQLLNPNGGENWAAGYSQVFFWNSSATTQSVKLEYSVDNGSNWSVIADHVENSGRYTWIVPNELTEQGLVRITDSDNAALFDVSDATFTIFELGSRSVEPDIPAPMTLTIDDVGWQLGKDDSGSNGPYRLGTDRDPVLEDYQVLVYVGQNVGTRLSAKFILSEFDRENLLANYPTTNEQGENWDNSDLTSQHDYDYMNYVKENAAWLELGLHGVRHEYWDWDNRNGKSFRSEFFNEREELTWPKQNLDGHLQAFQQILQIYDINSFPGSFTTPGNGYNYVPGSSESTGALLSPFGIRYTVSDIIRAGSFGVSQEVIKRGGAFDSGVLWIQQATNIENWPAWNAIGSVPGSFPEDGLPVTHWPNWWAQNPDDNSSIGDQYIDWFNQVKNNPDWYVPKNNAQYYSQWLYRNYTQVEILTDAIQIDNTSMPDEAYENNLLGNLIFKFELAENSHISSVSIDNAAEIVGYYEEMGFGYVILSRLEKKSYHLEYTIGSTELSTYVLNDGTYNVESFKTFTDSAIVKLEMFGTQEVKIKLSFNPQEVVSKEPDLIVNNYSFEETNDLLTINVYGKNIMGQYGEIVIRATALHPSLTITSPNGGEQWNSNSLHTITWNSVGLIDSVGLYYSLDTGVNWINIVSSTVNDSSYDWIVPDTSSKQALVKIISVNSEEDVRDISDEVFSIVNQQSEMEIVINCDDEYELWVNGEYIGSNDQWDVAQNYVIPLRSGKNVFAVHGINSGGPGALIAEVKENDAVVLVTDSNWKRIATEEPGWTDVAYDDSGWFAAVSHGQYGVEPWKKNISGFPENSQAEWIWSEDIKDEQLEWYFRGSFENGESVPAPEISSFTPDSGEVGAEVTISGTNFIDVTAVNFNDVSAGSYTVDSETQICAVVAPGSTTGRISVTASGGTGVSSDDFVVIEEPGITVTQPNGGEHWLAGSTQQIKWNWTGRIDSVRLEYSLDSGGGWIEISGSVVNDGVYEWIVPEILSDSALVRITDRSDISLTDASDNIFAIVAQADDMEIIINCDDKYQLWVNETFIGEDEQWDVAQTYFVPVVQGKNVLAVYGWNRGSGDRGLIVEVKVNGNIVLLSDDSWLQNDTEISGWTGNSFDDSNWKKVVDEGQYGIAPWNKNIVGFPEESKAHWIWGDDVHKTYFRGSFQYGLAKFHVPTDSSAEKSRLSRVTPDAYNLSDNYPNPFKERTSISYQLPENGLVTIKIFDAAGREIRTLVQHSYIAGVYSVNWDGTDRYGEKVGSGIYFYQMTVDHSYTITKKLLVIK